MSEARFTKEEMTEAREITRMALEQPISQESEMTGMLKQLNEDRIEPDSRLQSIDLRTRLHPFELTSLIVHDSLVSLGCLPSECLITSRTKKRLSVSLKGKGREEMVDMVRAERGHRRNEGGFVGGLKSLISPNKD